MRVDVVVLRHVRTAASRLGRPVSRRAEEAAGPAAGSRIDIGRGEPAAASRERPAEGSAEETESGTGRYGQGDRAGQAGQDQGNAPAAAQPAERPAHPTNDHGAYPG